METGTPTDFNKPKEKTPWLVYVVVFIFIIMCISMCGGDDEETPEKAAESERVELSQTEADLIREVEMNGYARFEPGSRDVYVKPMFWYAMNHTAKKNFGAICAVKYGNEQGSTLYYVNIIDDMTGKKLAEYSETWGLEIEE